MTQPAVAIAVLADDLIWASRLIEAVRRAGAEPVRLSSEVELERALAPDAVLEPAPGQAGAASEPEPQAASPAFVGVLIDLGGRRYDGIAAIGRAAAAGLPVIAVAQHDDLETRRRALAAGAGRVFSYNRFFTDGQRLVEAWLRQDGGDT